jgi:hypothetical protein
MRVQLLGQGIREAKRARETLGDFSVGNSKGKAGLNFDRLQGA